MFLGVLGESAELFADFPKNGRWRARFRKVCALLLLLGLAGELASLIRTSELSGRIDAVLRQEAAQAEVVAAEANKQTNVAIERQRALEAEAEAARVQQERLRQQNLRFQSEVEKERAARLLIEERMSPRTLSASQCAEVRNLLAGLRGARVTVGSPPDDPESANFAEQITACLRAAGLNVEVAIGRLMSSRPPGSLWMEFDPEKWILAEGIARALIRAKVTIGPVPARGDLKNGTVSIFVEKKPLTAPRMPDSGP